MPGVLLSPRSVIMTTTRLPTVMSVTANLVVSFYFVKRGFENVARIIKR
jgi:hypothetical protein